jgi:nicotinamidase-related amidase
VSPGSRAAAIDPKTTALLVMDYQLVVVADASAEKAHERDAVVANIGSLIEKARREDVPVVWVQHSDEQLRRGSDSGSTILLRCKLRSI